ncbi:MAG: hypothetical protein GF399_07290 [Candidatus Coatesbacteria bacterium]|nr:hypothetical protein [Candidatus Coatesbacteria bacterium]
MRRTAVLLLLIVSLATAAGAPALELEDPVLPGMNLTDSRAEYREYLENDGWKLTGDEWCLWGEKDDIEDVAYCFDDKGELLSVEYNRRCPGDSWSAVLIELSEKLTELMGPKSATGGPRFDCWSGGGWNAELSAKYLDEADGLDPVVHLEIYR